MARIKIQRENRKPDQESKDKFLFPVGKINQLTICPLNFEEFLYNRNKVMYDMLLKSYRNKETIDDLIHTKLMNYFYDYLLLGGMPEVVNEFIEANSYQAAIDTLIDLCDNYLGDMQLYQVSPESIIQSKRVFENVYTQLNKKTKILSHQ